MYSSPFAKLCCSLTKFSSSLIRWKRSIKSKDSMPWVRYALGNVLQQRTKCLYLELCQHWIRGIPFQRIAITDSLFELALKFYHNCMLQSISRAFQERYIRNLRQRKCSKMLKNLFLSLLIMTIFCSLVDSCCSNRRKLSEGSERKLEKLLQKKNLKANDRIVRRFCERPTRPPSTGSGTCCKYPISICPKYFWENWSSF